MSRRELLQALTVGAGSLAFARRGLAATPVLPRRIVFFPIANGVTDYSDFASAGAMPSTFTLGPFTAQLEKLGLRDQLVLIDNLEMKRAVENVDTHFCGMTQVLTGPYPADHMTQRSAHVSLDQYLAKTLAPSTPFGELYMGTMCDSLSYSYLADGTSVPPNSNPLDVYAKVFGSLNPNGADAALRKRLARRRTVLDSVARDVTGFVKTLPSEDRARAEVQLEAVRSMERRIDGLLAAPLACAKPSVPINVDYSKDTSVPQTLRAMVDLAVAALACDQTRVVMMHSYAREYHPPNFHCPWPPVNVPDWSFHELSHNLEGSTNFGAFKAAKGFHYQVAGELANKLKAIPELGGTMLDHTLIFIPSEIGRGHTPAGLQFLTIGGGGLGVKTGQHLQLGGNRDIGGGTPHQRMLVSLLHALGLPDTTFGEGPGTGSGPLSGYFA